MTREEAIKILSNYDVNGRWHDVDGYPYDADVQMEAFDMAIDALRCSEKPNSSDLISRQDALDILYDFAGEIVDTPGGHYNKAYKWYRKIMESLPSADRPKGYWYIREYEYFTCSECGEDYRNCCDCTADAEEKLQNGDCPNFCPNCGVDMRGDTE